MAVQNTFLTVAFITKRALPVLRNNTVFTRTIDSQYSSEFANKTGKIGSTTNVRLPAQFTVSSGAAFQPQGITENYVPLILNNQLHVDTSVTSYDYALSLNDLDEQYIKPAMAQLATQIDNVAVLAAINGNGSANGSNSIAGYGGSSNYTGTLGSGNLTFDAVTLAEAYLDGEAAPSDSRWLGLNPFASQQIRSNLKGLPLPFTLNQQIYERGRFLDASGMIGAQAFVDQNFVASTGGAYGSSTPVVGTSTSVGIGSGWAPSSSITITGMASGASTLNQGDLISFGTSSATWALPANPLNRLAYIQSPRTFTIVNTTTDSSGTITAQISPALIYGGQFQNCVTPGNAAIAAGTTVNIVATTGQVWTNSLLYHKNAYTIAYADLPVGREGKMMSGSRMVDPSSGISLRMMEGYLINDDTLASRLDVLFGCAPLRPNLGVRLLS